MNDNKQAGGILAAVVLTFLTLTFSFCGVVNASNNKDSTRPFPLLPASIEESIHNGKKGCMPSDENYFFGITENEGLITLGALSFVQTPEDGAHALVVVYHEEKDFGYILTNKGDGMLCFSEKLKNFNIQPSMKLPTVSDAVSYSAKDCSYTRRYTEMCGTFKKLAGGLIKTGFEIKWRAERSNAHTLTLLSGNGKTYLLTTNKDTDATVITGSGEDEFTFINIPSTSHQ
jgi:hypothetical protein